MIFFFIVCLFYFEILIKYYTKVFLKKIEDFDFNKYFCIKIVMIQNDNAYIRLKSN
jgi:hypothetical protein